MARSAGVSGRIPARCSDVAAAFATLAVAATRKETESPGGWLGGREKSKRGRQPVESSTAQCGARANFFVRFFSLFSRSLALSYQRLTAISRPLSGLFSETFRKVSRASPKIRGG